MAQCRGCGKLIDFVEMKSGKKMPVNREYLTYDSLEVGDIIVTDGGNVYKKEKNVNLPSVKGRESHFATCKQASEFRK